MSITDDLQTAIDSMQTSVTSIQTAVQLAGTDLQDIKTKLDAAIASGDQTALAAQVARLGPLTQQLSDAAASLTTIANTVDPPAAPPAQ